MLESVLPFVGALFLIVALAFIVLTTIILWGSFLYGAVMSCVVVIRQLTRRPVPTRP